MKIANRSIGAAHPPLVIAEIGINHGGDLSVAKDMVRLAAAAGCEARAMEGLGLPPPPDLRRWPASASAANLRRTARNLRNCA